MNADVKWTRDAANGQAKDNARTATATRAELAGRAATSEAHVLRDVLDTLDKAEGRATMFRAVVDFIDAGHARSLSDVREHIVNMEADKAKAVQVGTRSLAFLEGVREARGYMLNNGWA